MARSIFSVIIAAFLSVVASAAQVVLVDDLGRTVRLDAPARCIVSLAPSITESFFAIGAGDQVCGVTDYCTYPEAATTKRHVGGMTTPNIEEIVSLHPDLIVVSMEGNTRQDFDRLTRLGIPAFVSNPRTVAGIYRSLEQLGALSGHSPDAERLVRSLKAREDSLVPSRDSKRERVLLFISLDPLIAAGNNTFINDMLARAGAVNLAATATGSYPALSREAVLTDDPDALVLTSDLAGDVPALLKRFPEWKRLTAVQRGRVYRINPDLISRPGPRAVDGLELLVHFFRSTSP